MFKINSVTRCNESQVKVEISLDSKYWNKQKNSGTLGMLYGVDVSNAVSREYGVKAWYPTVWDKDRSKNGIKAIVLYYNDKAWVETPCNVIRVDFINKKRAA